MRISDWSSDVCSSDLAAEEADADRGAVGPQLRDLECGAGAADGHAEHAAGHWPGQFRGEHAVEADLLDIRHGGGSCSVGVRPRRGRCFRRYTRGAHTQTTRRSEEGRVGETCGSTCRARGAEAHENKRDNAQTINKSN